METALFLSDGRELERLVGLIRRGGWRSLLLGAGFRTAFERAAFERLLGALGPALDEATLWGVYVGNEACEHLVPLARTLPRLLETTARLGLGLGLALPPTYASREDLTLQLLGTLAASGRADIEVLCAEWGTVELVHATPPLKPVLGRPMGRMKRFARWSRTTPTPDLGALVDADADEVLANQVRVHRVPPLALSDERALADALGVAGAALDPVPQGLELSADDAGPLRLHVPWTYVTMGRHCVLRATVEGAERVDHDAACRRWCRTRYLLADYERPTAPIVQKGNAVYLENVAFLGRIPAPARARARWIVSPFV